MQFETYRELIVCYYSSQISKVQRKSSLIRPSTSNFQFCIISPNCRVLTPCPLSLLGSRRRLGFWGIWASLLDALHVLFSSAGYAEHTARTVHTCAHFSGLVHTFRGGLHTSSGVISWCHSGLPLCWFCIKCRVFKYAWIIAGQMGCTTT